MDMFWITNTSTAGAVLVTVLNAATKYSGLVSAWSADSYAPSSTPSFTKIMNWPRAFMLSKSFLQNSF
ncbi:hypothetical protein A1F99_030200 [Pyrenophora tritici-repentis]|nr:hypothetical protein A1F99_030200 [Pyrenophora tritici-repentis]